MRGERARRQGGREMCAGRKKGVREKKSGGWQEGVRVGELPEGGALGW